MRYIPIRGNKPELLGKNWKDQAKVNSLLGVMRTIGSAIKPFFFNPNYEISSGE